jgi:hypothetical protein
MVRLITFKQRLNEAAAEKDKHLTHIEDAVLEGGVEGTRNAIQFLIALRDMFADDGKTLSESQDNFILRTKFDGAPALYAGINPENGKFFVGSKSIFAKNSKLNYTQEDIRRNHTGGLAEKLSLALRYLPELGIRDIVHGDFMYSRNELKTETIDGKKYITFRPNTITYAVPVNSHIAHQVSQSQIGIVWHTTYYGKTMDNLQTHFDVNVHNFRPSKNVWYRENKFLDVTGKATLTKSENDQLTDTLKTVGQLFRRIPGHILNEISNNATYRIPIMTFTNQKIRNGETLGTNFVHDLLKFVADKYNINVTSAKKPETKRNRMVEQNKVMMWFRQNAGYLKLIVELQKLLVTAKNILIRKFNQCNDIGTFMHTAEGGYKVTGPEGYVMARSTDGTAYKLVDRLEFSKNNFLAAKNWKK